LIAYFVDNTRLFLIAGGNSPGRDEENEATGRTPSAIPGATPARSSPHAGRPPTQIRLDIPRQRGLSGSVVSGAINLSAHAPGADLVGFAAYRPAASAAEQARVIWIGHGEVDKKGIAMRRLGG
jgi:hypothetical protein